MLSSYRPAVLEALEPRLLLSNTLNDLPVRAELPDLTGTIDASRFPLSVTPGDAKLGVISVTVLLGNSGAAPANGTVTVDLYASANQSLDGGDTLLGTATLLLKNLVTGKAKGVKFSKIAVPSLAVGPYYILADVNSNDAIAESNTGNDTAVGGQTIQWLQNPRVELTSPADGAVVTTAKPTLSWRAFPDATQYRVQVSTSSAFTTGTREVTTTETSADCPTLNPGTQYYWRVIADTEGGSSLPANARKICYKAGVDLVLEDPTVNGATITAEATLTIAGTGTPLAGKKIAFYEETGGGVFVYKGTATTDVNGVAIKSWTTVGGSHQAYVSFVGDTAYAPNSTDPADAEYISYPPVVFNPPALPTAHQGVAYSASVATDTTPSGGNGGPYHYELGAMGGFPPTGIVLGADGMLRGTTNSPAGRYTFTVTAIDTAGNSASKAVSITVEEPEPAHAVDLYYTVTGTYDPRPGGAPEGTPSILLTMTMPNGIYTDYGGTTTPFTSRTWDNYMSGMEVTITAESVPSYTTITLKVYVDGVLRGTDVQSATGFGNYATAEVTIVL